MILFEDSEVLVDYYALKDSDFELSTTFPSASNSAADFCYSTMAYYPESVSASYGFTLA